MIINPLTRVYFEVENNIFPAATKSAHRAGPESAHDVFGVQAPIQCRTGSTPSNVYFSIVNGLNILQVKSCTAVYGSMVLKRVKQDEGRKGQ